MFILNCIWSWKRNIGAALRDSIERLVAYKDVGGSILYIITHSQSKGNEEF